MTTTLRASLTWYARFARMQRSINAMREATMLTSPVRLVSNLDQARFSHQSYQHAIAAAPSEARQVLIDAMPYAQNWIVIRDAKGQMTFAPSKFCGYHQMDANTYQTSHAHLDGRLTERVLTPWVQVVDSSDPDYRELRDALFAFCGQLGKKPNGRCRLSLLNSDDTSTGARDPHDTVLAELLVAVFKTLPVQQQRNVIRQITAR